MEAYLFIDIEKSCVNCSITEGFLAVGSLAIINGRIEDAFEGIVKDIVYDDTTTQFWSQHIDAWNYMSNNPYARDEQTVVFSLYNYLEGLKSLSNRWIIVTDNPAFDLGTLDALFDKYGIKTTLRSFVNKEYVHIDSIHSRYYGMKQLADAMGIGAEFTSVYFSYFKTSTVDNLELLDKFAKVYHTPVYDCLKQWYELDAMNKTLSYFKVKALK